MGENKVGTTVVSRYDYDVEPLGQRTGVSKKGTAFVGSQAEWAWKCDVLGEAIGADDADTPAAASVSGSQQGAGGVGGLVLWSRTHDSGASWESFYPCYDGNGNVTELLDSAGDIAAHWQYDPFGNTVASSPAPVNWASPVAHFPYRFSTKPLDFDLGMYYYGYRWYDPVTGRWPSRDPIEESGGVNLYSYVGNSTPNSFDLFGLKPSVNVVVSIQWCDDDGGVRDHSTGIGIHDEWLASTSADIDVWCNCGNVKNGEPNNDEGQNSFWWGYADYAMNIKTFQVSNEILLIEYISPITTAGDSWVNTALGIVAGVGAGAASNAILPGSGRAVGAGVGASTRILLDSLGDGNGLWSTYASATCPEWNEGDPVYAKLTIEWGPIQGQTVRRSTAPSTAGDRSNEEYVPPTKVWRYTR